MWGKRKDEYKHLNNNLNIQLGEAKNGLTAITNIDTIANALLQSNYGVHRLLCKLHDHTLARLERARHNDIAQVGFYEDLGNKLLEVIETWEF